MNRLVFKSRGFATSYNTRSTDIYKQQLFPVSTTCISALQTCSFCCSAPCPSGCPVYLHTCAKRSQAAKSKPLSHLQHPRAPRPTRTIPSQLNCSLRAARREHQGPGPVSSSPASSSPSELGYQGGASTGMKRDEVKLVFSLG